MPSPFRGRQPLGRALRELDRQIRAGRFIGGPGFTLGSSAAGITASADNEGDANEVGTITVDVLGCTFGSGEFTPGTGTALIHRRQGTSPIKWVPDYSVTVFNAMPNIIPAATDKLVIFVRADVLWVTARACD